MTAASPVYRAKVNFEVRQTKTDPIFLTVFKIGILAFVILGAVGFIVASHGLSCFLLIPLSPVIFLALTALFFKIRSNVGPSIEKKSDEQTVKEYYKKKATEQHGFWPKDDDGNWIGKNPNQTLDQFYNEKNMSRNPHQLLSIKDIEKLGLDLKETYFNENGNKHLVEEAKQKKPMVLRTVVEQVVNVINDSIKKNPNESSIQKQRYLQIALKNNSLLTPDDGAICHFKQYDITTLGEKKHDVSSEDDKDLWFPRILNALVEKKCIYSFRFNSSRGIFIQA
ncbi:MAG: hypothetical protein HZB76_01765 [Chlamydiae bacterium]|nr:hypothetical protein [Chlamydiota bacterium]